MRHLYQRSGIIASCLIALIMVIAVTALASGYQPGGDPAVFNLVPFSVGVLGICFILFSAIFLLKSYMNARGGKDTDAFGFFLQGLGAATISVPLWWWLIVSAPLFVTDSGFLATMQKLGYPTIWLYIVEQLAAGATFDAMESFKLRLTDIDYSQNDLAGALITFGIRLTGSLIVAALFVRALKVRTVTTS